MWLIDLVAKTYFSTQFAALMWAVNHPKAAQEKTLMRLLRKAEHTVYGRAQKFSAITQYEHFSAQVPIVEYQALFPYIERMLNGEQNVLWPNITRFSRSSGTTSGRSKFIPVSREGLSHSHIATGKHFLSSFLQLYPKSVFFQGKGIVLTGSYYCYPFASTTEIADVSALLYQHTDSWINYFKALPLSVALIDDWENKLHRIAECSIPHNITNISGVPTWMLLLFRAVLQKTGKSTIAEVWPNLELVIHGGVDFSPYQQQFETLIGKPVVYRNVYNASEGFFAFQYNEEGSLLLDLENEVFYEFEEEKTGKVVPLYQVEIAKRYAIIVTTNSGLWRYKIGDVVEFTATHPFAFKLVGRTGQFINVFGEELIQANAESAIAKTAAAFDVHVIEYTVAPRYFSEGNNGFHEWFIEFETPPRNLNLFEQQLDTEVQKLNSDYEAKRYKDLALRNLQIVPSAKGVFAQWLKMNQRLGVQAKIPRLNNDRQLIETLLAIHQKVVSE